MGKQTIAVCGHKDGYIHKMYEYFCTNYGEDFEIVLFTMEDSFEVYDLDNPVDILIAEEDFKIAENIGVGVKVILSEEPGEDGKVYKYTPSDLILKEALAQCESVKLSREKEYKESKKLLGVYSPIKRCFQTTFALTLGQILAKKHKVIYLNFESYSGFDSIFNSTSNTDLMDLIYFSECNPDDLAYRIISMKEKIGNLDYVSPVKAFFKYSEVSKDRWERLIDNLLVKTDYEYVILDLSENVNGLLDILKKCTHIYTIVDSERIANAKIAQYENLLKESVYEDILRKTANITLPVFKDIPKEAEMYPYSELADYIKKLITYEKVE